VVLYIGPVNSQHLLVKDIYAPIGNGSSMVKNGVTREADCGSRRRFLTTAGAVGVTAIVGCIGGSNNSGGSNQTDGTNSSSGSELLSAEVTVTHWPLLMYAPPYQTAIENGYFEEEGINLTSLVGSSGGGTTVRNVVTGGLPFGEVATPAAVNAFYAGAPLSIIASATNTPGTINWVTPKGSKFENITDLKGQTVGYTSAGSVTQNTSALAVRRADGIKVSDVEFQAMGGVSEGLTALEEGSIAAAANLDPVFSQQQQGEERWTVTYWARDYIQKFQQTCVIAGPDILENNPEAVRGYLRARARGVEFIRNNPDRAAEIFASYNDGYETQTMRDAIENVEPESYYTMNQFSAEGLRLIATGMKNIGLIDRNIEWPKIIDQSFLPESKRIDLSAVEQG
jgi:NitT/TauT family transport system substrate-binding protein